MFLSHRTVESKFVFWKSWELQNFILIAGFSVFGNDWGFDMRNLYRIGDDFGFLGTVFLY